MAELTITLVGVEALVAKLGRATAAATIERGMARAQARVIATLQKYPSPPSGSTYTRTGDLGRSWTPSTPSFSGGVILGGISNAARSRRGGQRYAKWVQGQETQTAGHAATGWITDQQALDRNHSAIENDFNSAIQNALNA